MNIALAWASLALGLYMPGVASGAALRQWLLDKHERSLGDSAAKLQAGWDALHTAQRLNHAFMQAQRAMLEEAVRQIRHRQ